MVSAMVLGALVSFVLNWATTAEFETIYEVPNAFKINYKPMLVLIVINSIIVYIGSKIAYSRNIGSKNVGKLMKES